MVKNEVVNNVAKSVVRKYKSGACESLPVLKKPVITWNNQNYHLKKNTLSFPLWIDGKSQRVSVTATITEYQIERLQLRLGSLRITQKNGKWVAQIAIKPVVVEPIGQSTMGVDLGLKIPAVAVTENGKQIFLVIADKINTLSANLEQNVRS